MWALMSATSTPTSPRSDFTVLGTSSFTRSMSPDVVQSENRAVTAHFKVDVPEREVSRASDVVDVDPAIISEALTRNLLDCTAAGVLDLEVLAAVLARVDNVEAIYVRDSGGETHVWTVIGARSDAALDAVFERELELYDYFGQRLASVEFHVLSRESAVELQMGRRVFERVR